jgi:hypothetical protein
MPYTNLELVKKHITLDDLPAGVKRDYTVVFIDQEWVSLPGRGLVEGSVVVKAIKDYSPIFEEITVGDGVVSLGNSNLVPNSVTLASDNSLGTIYKENMDYSVGYADGAIRRLNGSSIPDGKKVAVWYYYYSIYTEGSDYKVDYPDGMVRRLPDGDIQANQTVLVDYELSQNQLSNEVISEAVSEANAIVERQVDPEGEFGADLTLQAAATYLAVSLVCRMAAASDLRFGQFGYRTAPSWISLSESYRNDYRQLLKVFRPQTTRLNRPTHS